LKSNHDEDESGEADSRKPAAQRKAFSVEEEGENDGEDDNQVQVIEKDGGDDACDDVSEHSGGRDQEKEGSRAARIHALAEAASHGGASHSSVGSHTSAADQQGLAVAVLNQQMEGSGMCETQEQEKNRGALVVRTHLSKKMKFIMPYQMTHNGKVLKKMYQYMNYTDNDGFREQWDFWIAKHVCKMLSMRKDQQSPRQFITS
jgi:hypothetical protein